MLKTYAEDLALLNSARVQARKGFDKHRSLDASSAEARDAVAHAEGIAQILRHNVVQGEQQQGNGVLSMPIVRHHCNRG